MEVKRKSTFYPGILRRHAAHKKNSGGHILLFLLPSLVGLSIFVAAPFADVIRRSFLDPMGEQFVGLQNYNDVIGNSAFQTAAVNTLKFIGVCIPALLAASLILALLVRAVGQKGRLFKTTYLLPLAIPVGSIVLLWQVLFNNNGLINAILTSFSLPSVSFMDTDAAFWVLIFTYIWKNSGYNMILWLAGLDSISQSYYEAAKIDGAGPWQIFRYVTLPGLAPTLFMTCVLSVLNSFKVFREAYLVAGSYPNDSIYMLQHLFNNWFANLEISRLCAAAIIIAAVLLAAILFMQRALTEDE